MADCRIDLEAPWRAQMQDDERQEIEEIDRRAAEIDKERRQLTGRRSLIVQRCCQRALHQLRKAQSS